jgi:large subunit ribosomal protein LX
MSQFTVSGRFKTRHGWQTFERQLDAPNEQVAEEWTVSRFGAEHGLDRMRVDVSEVSAA